MAEVKPPRIWLFQSPEVSEIVSHMTAAEKAQLERIRGRDQSVVSIAIIVLILSVHETHLINRLSPIPSFWARLGVGILIGVIGGCVVGFRPWATRSTKAFLAASEFAQSRGLTAAGIRLYAFGRRSGQSPVHSH
jgi:hypothetical protein